MKIRAMRCCHIENPIGLFMERPVFTWTADETAARSQTAARIVIAADSKMTNILFDSGLRDDISSLGYTANLTLAPRTRYYWQVTVNADNGDCAVSDVAFFETGKRDELWQAKWIKAPFDRETHPMFRRGFTLIEAPANARIYYAGLGLCEMTVNGQAVTDEVLAPFYNDYRDWIQTSAHDVTALLHTGENRVEAMLGPGWYKGRFGFDESFDMFGDTMMLLAELHVRYADGTEEVIATEPGWDCCPAPVTFSNIYDGEKYDARIVPFADRVAAILADAPQGAVVDRKSPPLRVCDRLPVKEVLRTPAGEDVLDFGQVLTGWFEFDADMPAGAQLYLQFGELLQNDNFYRDNLRTALEEYSYISDGKPARIRPHFTFYGFRYIKVVGLDNIDPSKFTACVIHSDIEVTGSVETSNAKVNKLIKNAFWGQIGNFVDTPTDCPQRDERMGWTGDAQVFAPTASFNMYTPAFYDKFMKDMLYDQKRLGGSCPFVVPDVINIRRIALGEEPNNHGSCAWADAATCIPWTLYTFYGDKDMLARQYENMKLWVEWIRERDEKDCGGSRLWTCGFHFADWLALDNPIQGDCIGATDMYYIASAYYFYSVTQTGKAARVLGYTTDAETYEDLAEEIRTAFRKEFFTETGRCAIPTQTALLLALALDLVPDEFRERTRDALRARLAFRKDHLETGFVGTYFLCRTLSENGMNDLAYTLLLNEDYPGWLYEINMGATTVWERWNSVMPDGLVSDTGMNSMNHYAYGSVVEWMYRCMCGLNPDESAPGFAKAVIRPMTDSRFDFARARYDSASGLYESGWAREADGSVTYTVTVPFNCTAEFIPETPNGTWTLNGEAVEPDTMTLTSGTHVIRRT